MHGIIQCLTVGPIQLLSPNTKEHHGLSLVYLLMGEEKYWKMGSLSYLSQ